jgi:tryptophan synthase beta chain
MMNNKSHDEGVEVPRRFYNVQSVLDLPAPMGDNAKLLPEIFPMELLKEEMSKEKYVPIPEEVRDVLATYRPTPLARAARLEKYLRLPEGVKIFYKREDVSPTGSHKLNTAVMQAFLAREENFKRLATETGAGQWGSALSFACRTFGLDCTVYMVRSSFEQKPYRKVLMKLFGAEVLRSPSDRTNFGRKILKKTPDTGGSLGMAIAEAIEDALSHEDTAYSLGSVLNSVLMHQTVIGQEAKEQLKAIGCEPDVLIGCVGGGSNFGGLVLPFVEDKLRDKSMELIAVEPEACPSITKGEYRYDYGDAGMQTPLLKMYTLGYDFMPSPIHAGGLRYHGMAPIVSLLANRGLVSAVAYGQKEIFEAGMAFARTEGIVPAPETAHAIKATIDRALEAKKRNEEKTIVMNFSGHGFFDMKGYEDFMDGKLQTERRVTEASHGSRV